MHRQRWMAGLAFALVMSASLQADTIYLRDGSRVQGELIAVRNGTIEFEERRGYGSGRTLRFDRDEVVRIEFENARRSGGSDFIERRPAIRHARTPDHCLRGCGVERQRHRRPCRADDLLRSAGAGAMGQGSTRGPAGERNSPPNPNRPMGNRNAAALIGKIGNDLFFIGDETGPIRVRSSGRLQLGCQRRRADRQLREFQSGR